MSIVVQFYLSAASKSIKDSQRFAKDHRNTSLQRYATKNEISHG